MMWPSADSDTPTHGGSFEGGGSLFTFCIGQGQAGGIDMRLDAPGFMSAEMMWLIEIYRV